MALKDWKRVYPKNIKIAGMIWERKSDSDDEVHLFSVNIVPSPNQWRVVAQKGRNLVSKRDFKSKSQALRHARAYMVNH